MKKIGALLLVVLSCIQGVSQSTDRPGASKDASSFARVRLKYTSDYIFMGRADSLEAPYLSPSFTYFHKSGFFAKGAFSFLTSSDQNRIDLSTLSAGYNFTAKNVYVGGSVSSYFFNRDSYAVPSAMVGFLNGYVGYDFQIFELSIDGSLGLSEELDVFTGIELERTFYLFKNYLLIIPSVYINAGSQNYYNEYYRTRSSQVTRGNGYGKDSGQGTQGSGGTVMSSITTDIVVEEVSDFKILDYEFSTTFAFHRGLWRFNFIPKYAIPVNPSRVSADGEILFEESLDNVFFWSVSIGYTIN